MSDESPEKQSKLIAILREGVSIVQMIMYKEVRARLAAASPDRDQGCIAMLAGALVNEVFGTPNPEERFVVFRREHHALIEQELLGLREAHPSLLPALTDALRIQSLCDRQEDDTDSTTILSRAKSLDFLLVDRTVPMPSTFMTLVRSLGEQHGLIIAPVQITPEQDQATIH
jgi:hypothetical protein